MPTAQSDYGKFEIECETILNNILGDRAIIIRIPAIWGKDSPRWNLFQENIENNSVIDVYSNLIYNNLLDVVLAKQLRFIRIKALVVDRANFSDLSYNDVNFSYF